MEFIHSLVDIIMHLDEYLNAVVQNYGFWTYLILFCIIFAETGLVITPFLPGDSLLFAVGALSATGSLQVINLLIILTVAAILGDSANYALGKFIGYRVFSKANSRIFKKEYLDKTHKFYEKHGNKTIVLARFVPIVRTFAPFVAGVGGMDYFRFITYNIAGGFLWVFLLVGAGYFFGNVPVVKENFSLVILAIIVLSILPGVWEYWKHKKN